MAACVRRTLLAASLALAGAACAQSGSHSGNTYPNTSTFGIPFDHKAPWYRHCMRVQPMVAPATPARPASCKAFDYYDKLSQAKASQAEWNGVRACAVDIQDDTVLSMLFANGLGVTRNLDLATRYACRAGGAYAEVTARIAHLQALKASAPATRYDQCDDITSGYMAVICAGIAEQQAGKVRHAFIAQLRRQLPVAQQGALESPVSAASAYARQA